MRTIVISRFGVPEVLKIVERPVQKPDVDDVLIRVKAIGLNFADILARLGVYPNIPDPPFVPGLEFSGVVESVGSKTKRVKKGDRVMGFTRQGAYAEYVCVRANQVHSIPQRMTFVEAASIGVTYLTAFHGLVTLANMRKGERVLIHAAAGGVGTAAIQLAKHYGAEVFATASSAQKLEIARREGADHCINYVEDDFARVIRRETDGYGIDIVMDSVGGRIFRKGWKLLAPMGRYVLYGFASITGKRRISKALMLKEVLSVPPLFPPTLVSKNLGFFGFNLYFLGHKITYLRATINKLLRLYGQNKIKPVVGRTFPFEEVVSAHEHLQSRESIGKVVLVI